MFEGMRVAVVVPAYREERLIGRTLRSIPEYVDCIVVVDDASPDKTAACAREVRDARVIVLRHSENRGVGAAIVSGYRAAFSDGADIAVVMAGDGQMDPCDLPALIAPLARGEADYTKGNRLAWPNARARMPTDRWLGNHALSFLTRLSTGLSVRDSQCGYTALTREGADRLPLDELWPRYGYPNDLLGGMALAQLRVMDVPVRPIYADEESGIGYRHAFFVVPFVLLRVALRRLLTRAIPFEQPARLPSGR